MNSTGISEFAKTCRYCSTCMKKHLSYFVALFIFTSLEPVISQKLISNSSVTGVCYAGNKINRIYIPPPDEFFKKSGGKGGASITVYIYRIFQPGKSCSGICSVNSGNNASCRYKDYNICQLGKNNNIRSTCQFKHYRLCTEAGP